MRGTTRPFVDARHEHAHGVAGARRRGSRRARWPSRMRCAPGTRFSSAPRSMRRSKSEAAPSSAGKMPRTIAGRRFAPAASMPSSRTYGVTAATPGALAKRRSSSRQSAKPSRRRDRRVRAQREQARPRLGLEAVQHRQNDDQRRDAEREAEQRRRRPERHERAPAPRAQVAQADEPLERLKHEPRIKP